jgi:hypothetical protein
MSLGLLLSQEWGSRPVEELVHEADEADEALYAAKGAGRNCVKVAVPKTALKVGDSAAAEAIRLRRSPVVIRDC